MGVLIKLYSKGSSWQALEHNKPSFDRITGTFTRIPGVANLTEPLRQAFVKSSILKVLFSIQNTVWNLVYLKKTCKKQIPTQTFTTTMSCLAIAITLDVRVRHVYICKMFSIPEPYLQLLTRPLDIKENVSRN